MKHKRRRSNVREAVVNDFGIVEEEKKDFGFCAVQTCSCRATQNHHFIPQRFISGNSFTLQLCEHHHKIADEMLKNIDICTPLKFFKIMFEFIYGRGSAYRQLRVGKNTMDEIVYSIH